MEAVKKFDEKPEENPLDSRTDLEELDDLVLEMREIRRKLTKIAMREMKKCMYAKQLKKVHEDTSFEVKDLWNMYAILEKSYNSLYKLVFPKGHTKQPQGQMVDMGAVKEKPSTIGEIVRTTRQPNGE